MKIYNMIRVNFHLSFFIFQRLIKNTHIFSFLQYIPPVDRRTTFRCSNVSVSKSNYSNYCRKW